MIRQPRYIKKVQNIVLPFFLVFSFFITKTLFAQERGFVILDSLRNMSYEELEKGYNENSNDRKITDVYAMEYLHKGKNEKDTLRIIDGYFLFVESNSGTKKAMPYTDSIILIAKKSSKLTEKLAEGFYQKGVQLFYISKYRQALENYIKASDIIEKENNRILQLRIKHGIGLLKNEIDNEKEALQIFKENFEFFKNDTVRSKHKSRYLGTLCALSDAYNRNQKPDSAELYSRLGINESMGFNDKIYYYLFLLNYGVAKAHKKEFRVALDSLLKGSELVKENRVTLCDTYLIISDVYERINNQPLFVKYLKSIDSIYIVNPEVYSQARSANKKLLRHYQKQNNIKLQLTTINKLIKLDSIHEYHKKDLNKQIVNKYEVPILMQEKEKLIKTLNKNKTNLSVRLFILFLVFILTLGGLLFLIKKNRNYKNKYDELLKSRKEKKKKVSSKPKNIDNISGEQVAKIIEQLDKFEKNLNYLNNEISLAKTATFLGTNSSYLSKVINSYKAQNFSGYINELRIEYALEKIPNDKKLLNYTITALAHEFGYNNSESFSKAFYARTGIYPSYFIKQLKK